MNDKLFLYCFANGDMVDSLVLSQEKLKEGIWRKSTPFKDKVLAWAESAVVGEHTTINGILIVRIK